MSLLLVQTLTTGLLCNCPCDNETRHTQLQIEHKRKKPPLGGRVLLHVVETGVQILMEVIGLLRELHGKQQEVAGTHTNAGANVTPVDALQELIASSTGG